MPGSAIQSGGEGIEGMKTQPIDYVLPVVTIYHLGSQVFFFFVQIYLS